MTTSSNKLKTFQQNEQKEQNLRNVIARLTRQLEKAKFNKEELVSAVYRAASDAASGLVIPNIPKPKLINKNEEEVAIICFSDLQLSKVTTSYNTDVAEERVKKYAEKIALITSVQRHDHAVKKARIYLLGDEIEGEVIFSHQPWQVDASLFRQVTVDGPRILITFLRSMLNIFEEIYIIGIPGNHGRISESYKSRNNPETNADRMLYQIVKDRLEESGQDRITWNIPWIRNERAWYTVDKPFNKQAFMLFHGDQIRGGSFGFPWYSTGKRIPSWAAGGIPETFQYAIFGHFHNPTRITLNHITVWCNGTFESDNDFARENLSSAGRPTQLLMFLHPKQGITGEYWVHLD